MPAPQLAPAASPAAPPLPAAPGSAPLTASTNARPRAKQKPYNPGFMTAQVAPAPPPKATPAEGLHKMSFMELWKQLHRLDAEQPFKLAEWKLYTWWLEQFNSNVAEYWPEKLHRQLKHVAVLCGMDDKTAQRATDALERRGLLLYEPGTKHTTATWRLSYQPPQPREVNRKKREPKKGQPQLDRNFSGREDEMGDSQPQLDRNFSAPLLIGKDEDVFLPVKEDLVGSAGAMAEAQKKIAGAQAPAPPPAPLPPAPVPGGPSGPSGPGPDDKPRQGSERSRAMTARLAAYFGIGEVAHAGHYHELGRFSRYVEATYGLDYLDQQFSAYVAQKKLTGQNIGSWTNYIAAGTETFDNGKWKMQCWVHKLAQDLAEPRHQATALAQGPEALAHYLALVPAASAYFTSTTPTHAAAHSPRSTTGKPSPSRYAIAAVDFDTDD